MQLAGQISVNNIKEFLVGSQDPKSEKFGQKSLFKNFSCQPPSAWNVYTNANLFFDQKKNRIVANIRPSLHFYGMIILVKKTSAEEWHDCHFKKYSICVNLPGSTATKNFGKNFGKSFGNV